MNGLDEISEIVKSKNLNSSNFDLEAYQVEKYNSQKIYSDFICESCNGSGMVAYLNASHKFALKECKCKRIRASMMKLKNLGLYDFLNKAKTVEELPENEEWEKAVKSKLLDYNLNHKNIFWLFIGGQVGSGKTTKATMVLKKLIEENDYKFFEYFNWDTQYKKLIFSKDKEEMIKDLQDADILYIDDFFRHQNSNIAEMEREVAKEILDYRYLNKLQTIITSELHLNEISTLDEAIGSRIYQMCGKERFTIQIKREKERNYRTKGIDKLI